MSMAFPEGKRKRTVTRDGRLGPGDIEADAEVELIDDLPAVPGAPQDVPPLKPPPD